MKDEIKEILGEIYNIQLGYMKPVYKRDYSNKDYVIESYENLVFRMKNCITNLQKELEVSQTNEEIYRLEMLDITKCLGLDEDTIFDEVKEHATNLQKENEHLKYHLNDVVFDDFNDNVELAARLLRKLGYIDFDEERKVYVNKHNNQPLMETERREKVFWLKDDELDDYTKQVEENYKDYKSRCEKAKNKINSMFINGDENILIDDLIELDDILEGGEQNE